MTVVDGVLLTPSPWVRRPPDPPWHPGAGLRQLCCLSFPHFAPFGLLATRVARRPTLASPFYGQPITQYALPMLLPTIKAQTMAVYTTADSGSSLLARLSDPHDVVATLLIPALPLMRVHYRFAMMEHSKL